MDIDTEDQVCMCTMTHSGRVRARDCQVHKLSIRGIEHALTYRAIQAINKVIHFDLYVNHDGVVLRLAYNLGDAWQKGNAELVCALCDQIEALKLEA